MTKGTTKYAIRIPIALVNEINTAVAQRNMKSAEAPWTFSDFVRQACMEKVQKMERSRGKKARRLLLTNDKRLDCVQEMF